MMRKRFRRIEAKRRLGRWFGSQFVGLSSTEGDILSYEVALAISALIVSRSSDSSGNGMSVVVLAKRKEDARCLSRALLYIFKIASCGDWQWKERLYTGDGTSMMYWFDG